jgi:hypothetical protein
MARIYTVSIDRVAVAAAQDLITLLASSTVPIEIHAVNLGQKTLTAWEAKDITFKRVPATVTITGGTAVTPRPMTPNDSASAVTATINNTTLATSTGTIATLLADEFNFLNGFYWSPAGQDDRIIIAPSQAFCLRLGTAPSASMNVSGSVTFAELV